MSFKRANPDVEPLSDNGGAAETVALGSGSAALRAGTGCPMADERGILRRGTCAIGAYQPSAPTISLGKTRVTATSAQINAEIAVDSGSGTATIRYGTSTHLTAVQTAALGASVSPEPAKLALRGLTPEQTYHYEVWVTTSDGTTASGMRTLHTGVGPVLTSLRVASGRLTYSDNEPARTTVQVLRCVATRKGACTSYRAAAKLTRTDRAGTNVTTLPKLAAGRYELTATPVYRGIGGATTIAEFTVAT